MNWGGTILHCAEVCKLMERKLFSILLGCVRYTYQGGEV